jgi:hypothetical protein
LLVIKIIDGQEDEVILGANSKEDAKAQIIYAGNLVAHTLAKLDDIPVEVAAIEIMQAINLVTNELSQEENEHE